MESLSVAENELLAIDLVFSRSPVHRVPGGYG
jgi:hypothetical protein